MLVALVLACTPGAPDSTDTGAADPRRWEVLFDDLPGVLLSITGRDRDDLWAVGADAGEGPEFHHWDGASWATLDPGVSGDLWWSWAGSSTSVWACGEGGLLLRLDRTTGAIATVPSPTTATLFGTWGASDTRVYAVGGFVSGEAEDGGDLGVVLRVDNGVASRVTDLPADRDPEEMYFKVWGTGDDDVWVVGNRGSLLRFDGHTWTREVLPGGPRLVTVSGRDTTDVVVVGGQAQGQVFERVDGVWTDVAPPSLMPVNGVFVHPSGAAVAAGFSGQVLERDDRGWAAVPPADRTRDWHAAWIDDQGAIYAAGGDFMGMVGGALYRYAEP